MSDQNREELLDSIEMPYTEHYGEVNNHMYFVNDIKAIKEPDLPIVLLKRHKDRQ